MAVVDTNAAPPSGVAPPSGLAEFWFYFSRNKGAVIGLAVFLVILLLAVFAPIVSPHSPSNQNRDVLLLPPSWAEGGQFTYLLGTDPVGRDILTRLIYGARFSLFIGLVVVSLSVLSGVMIGLIAGYFRGRTDTIIMRVMDIILAFPSLASGARAGGGARAGSAQCDDRHFAGQPAAFRPPDPRCRHGGTRPRTM